GRLLGDVVDRDVAAGAGAVLDHDLLADLLAERALHDARGGVGAAAGLEADHDGDRLAGVLGKRRAGDQRQPCQNEPHTTPPSRSFLISSALYFSSRRISSVCSPISGVGATTLAGVRDSTAALARMFLRPSFLCSTGVATPRCFTCGSANTSSTL